MKWYKHYQNILESAEKCLDWEMNQLRLSIFEIDLMKEKFVSKISKAMSLKRVNFKI